MSIIHKTNGIRYLSVEDLININEYAITSFTPLEGCGVLDLGKLKSAQQRPNNYRYYEHCEDIYTLAAVLFIAVNKAHAFKNANKRTAFMASMCFLLMNGYCFEPYPESVIEASLNVAKNIDPYLDPVMLSSWFKAFSEVATTEELEESLYSSSETFQAALDFDC
ncbi:MAG: death-on-curing protein [Oleiphilaceae bacterium]|jgi:death-on-curing protein